MEGKDSSRYVDVTFISILSVPTAWKHFSQYFVDRLTTTDHIATTAGCLKYKQDNRDDCQERQ